MGNVGPFRSVTADETGMLSWHLKESRQAERTNTAPNFKTIIDGQILLIPRKDRLGCRHEMA
jgi:hypothetical protein